MTKRAIIERPADDVFALTPQGPVTVAQFCADVSAAAALLPESALHVVNLCQNRYAFMVAFFAIAVSGRINLLPGKRDAETAHSLSIAYPRCISVADDIDAGADVMLTVVPGASGRAVVPSIDDDAVVAIAFTSGSTGEPQPHHKSWAMFGGFRHVHWHHVPEELRRPARIVATVPPWHMYGLEWSMLVPMIAPLTIWCGPDFYPKDVVAAIETGEGAAVLVSTPLHLRALVRVPAPDSAVTMAISATAPLEAGLVGDAETHLHSRLFEIYGCSEIGSLAWRLPSSGEAWHFFDCFPPDLNDGSVIIRHPLLPAPVTLPDLFSGEAGGGLRLLGRATDVVKVGGKRESLAHLNSKLVSTPGVVDGTFYQPESFGLPATGRLAAVVCAPGLEAREVRSRLAAVLDPVFLPRPLHLVDGLPRDATSKLRRESLAELLLTLHG